MSYGSKAWLEHMFSRAEQGEDLWGHQWRAIQKYRYSLTLSLVHERIAAQEGQRILDLGCGLGDFAALIYGLNNSNTVFGTDLVFAAVRAASKRHTSIRFVASELPMLPTNGPIDGVAALECLNYLDRDNRKVAIGNIASVLSDAGWFLFSGHLGRDPSDTRYVSEEEARSSMEAAGLQIESVKYNYAVLYNAMESVFLRLANLPPKLETLRAGGPAESKAKRFVQKLVRTPVVGSCILIPARIGELACKLFLTYLQPPGFIRFMQHVSKHLLGQRGRSHVIMLAVKRH